MRGDSLRDFYAKTLAVVGLGLLAGAGAIVDYWPVNGELPSVRSVAAFRPGPSAPQPELAAVSDIEIPAPQVILASERRAPRPAPAAFAKSFQAVRFVEPAATPKPVVAPIPELNLGTIEHGWPSAMLTTAAVELDLTLELPQPLHAEPAEPMTSGGPSSSRSFVNSAVGALNALKKTRASLKDAVRGVVGTFRKVSPFWDATAVSTFR